MGKDGWLDQVLVGVLNFLNQTWLSIAVAFVGGLLVAFLARRAPGQDWAYIKDGPGNLLLSAFLLLAALKSIPRFVLPKTSFTCDQAPGPLGFPVTTNCGPVSVGRPHFEGGYSLREFVRDYTVSLLQDLVYGGLGALVGIALATLVTHVSGPRPRT